MSTREERRQEALDGYDPNCIGCALGICTISHDADAEEDA